jgi:hypothetical protein
MQHYQNQLDQESIFLLFKQVNINSDVHQSFQVLFQVISLISFM